MMPPEGTSIHKSWNSYDLVALAVLTALGLGTFLIGINWGLPSRATDKFLFGSHAVWSGTEILRLAGVPVGDSDRATDVSSRPLTQRGQPQILNSNDVDRARIIRRYRLMSHQPDEFATFAALARMQPTRLDLDPRMYKYGGLWIYPIGAMLRTAAFLGIIQLRSDMSFYLDHSEAFGRFYVVARLYSAAWGVLGVAVIYILVQRISARSAAGVVAAVCFAWMPVVVTAAHEAKPHLAGAVLIMTAVSAAARYSEGGTRRSGFLAALLSGAAMGMVPSAAPVLLLLPGMVLMRRRFAAAHPARAAGSVSESAGWLLLACIVYGLSNPYVPLNLFRNPAVLASNIGNSSGFYRLSLTGLPHAIALLSLGTSTVLMVAGAGLAVALLLRARRTDVKTDAERQRRSTGMLLAAPALAVGVTFILFAADQPADYARFALPTDLFLLVEAVVGISTFVKRGRLQWVCYLVLIMTTGAAGLPYVWGFLRDTRAQTTRSAASSQLDHLLDAGRGVLVTREEPAPWSLPPADVFRWRMILPSRGSPILPAPGSEVGIEPVDRFGPGSTPISWASKPYEISAPQ